MFQRLQVRQSVADRGCEVIGVGIEDGLAEFVLDHRERVPAVGGPADPEVELLVERLAEPSDHVLVRAEPTVVHEHELLAGLRHSTPVPPVLEGLPAAGERVTVEPLDREPGAGGPDVREVERRLHERAHLRHGLVVPGRTDLAVDRRFGRDPGSVPADAPAVAVQRLLVLAGVRRLPDDGVVRLVEQFVQLDGRAVVGDEPTRTPTSAPTRSSPAPATGAASRRSVERLVLAGHLEQQVTR
ncbi:hypothetical protein BRC93_13480 [Halobacteriales archaeon QS_5_70_15]|nr:MAG: hypothetical protein BRC93_13480 [Halobacteriales archaeon QS_5_70_15]